MDVLSLWAALSDSFKGPINPRKKKKTPYLNINPSGGKGFPTGTSEASSEDVLAWSLHSSTFRLLETTETRMLQSPSNEPALIVRIRFGASHRCTI